MKRKAATRQEGAGKQISRDFVVASDPGLYLLPAAIFARTANRFASEILVTNGDLTVDGKSTMGLMSLCATKGTVLSVTAKGADSTQALQAIESFLIAPFKDERDRMLTPSAKPTLQKIAQWSSARRRASAPAEYSGQMLAHMY